MAYYALNGQNPVPNLPTRWRKEDGTTVTDLESLDAADLEALGWTIVPDPPDHSLLNWDNGIVWSAGEWKIITVPEKERNNRLTTKWIAIKEQRDNMINAFSARIEKYNSEIRRGVTPTVDIAKIDEYIEKLRQVPQTQDNPYNITWPNYDDGGKGE